VCECVCVDVCGRVFFLMCACVFVGGEHKVRVRHYVCTRSV